MDFFNVPIEIYAAPQREANYRSIQSVGIILF